MTVNELIDKLQKLKNEGYGDFEVISHDFNKRPGCRDVPIDAVFTYSGLKQVALETH